MSASDISLLPAAVLWDLDGTLVDTEPLWFAAEDELAAEYGLEWTHDDSLNLVGNPLIVSAEIFRDRGVSLPAEDIVARLIAAVDAAVLRDGPTWRPGARELVAQFQSLGVPQAIVTMSYLSQAEAVERALPEGAIATIVSGDMVTQGKPHPEPYLLAASRLEVPIENCLAIEDSATGLRAAWASGAHAVGVPNMVALPELDGAIHLETLAGHSARDLAVIGGFQP